MSTKNSTTYKVKSHPRKLWLPVMKNKFASSTKAMMKKGTELHKKNLNSLKPKPSSETLKINLGQPKTENKPWKLA